MRDSYTLSYRPEIDGLRGVAVLAVMLFHAQFPHFDGGYIGVDIFFVISGYLITRILGGAARNGGISIAHFYERRARRILPAMFVMCAFSTLLAWHFLTPPALEEFGSHLLGSSLFVANIVYWLQSGYFATEAEYLPLLHTWSLAIEEQFYLFFPVLLLVLLRARNAVVVAALAVLGFASLLLAHRWSHASTGADAAFFLLPMRCWELLAGAVVARLEATLAARRPLPASATSALAALGLVMCVVPVFTFDAQTPHPSFYTAVPVVGVCMLILFGTAQSAAGRLLAASPIVALGLISYSAYLYHQPVLVFSRIALARELTLAEAAGALLVSLAIAAVSWRWVEQPFRRPGFSPRFIAFGSATALAGTAAAGALLLVGDGFPSRMGSAVSAAIGTIEAGFQARAAGIRQGKCHFNKDIVSDIDDFLQAWDCLPAGTPRILVVGDSIAADKAWVLREAGFAVGNIGGAGCHLVPPSNTAEPCWGILDKARQIVRTQHIAGLVLGNNWTAPLAGAELEALVAYWSQLQVPILVFSGMPNFAHFNDRIVKYLHEGRPLESIDFDEAAFAAHLASLAPLRKAGFAVIDSRALLCGTDGGACGAFVRGEPLIGDPTHLQPAGVRIMAERIRHDRTWLDWYSRLN